MRAKLAEAGFKLDIGEVEKQSLAEPIFRNLESGRGIGVVAILRQDKAEAMMAWCNARADGGPKIGGVHGTEGRGLRQLTADILQLVATPEPTQEMIERFCLRTNQRVKKGLLWDYRGQSEPKEIIRLSLADVPDPEKTFASVPSGSVSELWSFLTSNN
jgi:hypothetical protein